MPGSPPGSSNYLVACVEEPTGSGAAAHAVDVGLVAVEPSTGAVLYAQFRRGAAFMSSWVLVDRAARGSGRTSWQAVVFPRGCSSCPTALAPRSHLHLLRLPCCPAGTA